MAHEPSLLDGGQGAPNLAGQGGVDETGAGHSGAEPGRPPRRRILAQGEDAAIGLQVAAAGELEPEAAAPQLDGHGGVAAVREARAGRVGCGVGGELGRQVGAEIAPPGKAVPA